MPPRKLQGEDLFLFFGLSSFLILFASVATQSFPAQVSSPSFLVFDWPVACIRGRALFFSEIFAEPGAPAGYSARRQSTEGSRRIVCGTAARPRVMSSHQMCPSFFSVRVSNALFSFSRLCPNPILPPQVSFAQARGAADAGEDSARAGERPAPVSNLGAEDAGEDSARMGERPAPAGDLGAEDPGKDSAREGERPALAGDLGAEDPGEDSARVGERPALVCDLGAEDGMPGSTLLASAPR